MLLAENIEFTYEGGDRLKVQGVCLQAKRGEIVGIVGKSGVGKSTLARIMAGLLKPTKGNVTVGGLPVIQPSCPVGMVLQDYNNAVFPWLNVRKNMALGQHKPCLDGDLQRFTIEEASEILQIDHLLEAYPSTLSGGQRQRVQIGRLLVSGVRFLVLDEPDTSLDMQFKKDLQNILVRLANETQMGIVFVSHNIDQVVYLSDRLYLCRGSSTQSLVVKHYEGYGHAKPFEHAADDLSYRDIFRNVYEELFC